MEQTQNTPVTLDGKKKFIATLCSIAASFVGLFLTPDNAETVVQVIMVGGPLILGILYDWMQTRHDIQKQAVELKREERIMVEVQNGNGKEQAQVVVQTPPPPPTVLDIEAFHTQVLSKVTERYPETNPCTVFYQARDLGTITPCDHISQAQDFWSYLVELVKKADAWMEEQIKKDGPCSKQSPAYYAIHREYSSAVRMREELAAVAFRSIDWQTKLARQDHTLYNLGMLSSELLKYASKS